MTLWVLTPQTSKGRHLLLLSSSYMDAGSTVGSSRSKYLFQEHPYRILMRDNQLTKPPIARLPHESRAQPTTIGRNQRGTTHCFAHVDSFHNA
eukprot:scaffold2859_cov349-Pavlova_lutheri.AAC.35